MSAIDSVLQHIARRYGVGGETWTVTSAASGLGGTPTSAASVTGKAVQARLGEAGATGSGQMADVVAWRFVAFSGTLAAKQQITDGTYTFDVVGEVEPSVYEVTRL